MGLSPMHLILILIIVLVIFGPSRLPGLGRGVGEAIRGFKKGLEGGDEIDVTPKSGQRKDELNPSAREPAHTSAAQNQKHKEKQDS